MRFREHTKAEAVQLADRAAVIDYLRECLAPWPSAPDPAFIVCEYSHDSPSWGKTYIVTLPGYGVIGFSDEPL